MIPQLKNYCTDHWWKKVMRQTLCARVPLIVGHGLQNE